MKLTIKKFLGLAPNIKPDIQIPVETHGKGYGSWVIAKDSLSTESKIFSIGIGTDIWFDLSIILKYGANVHAFDPTPEVVSWIGKMTVPTHLKFSPVALAAADKEVKFYKPLKEGYISYGVGASSDTQEFINVPARRLCTLIKELNITHIDLLKMDIEGFEYEVIDDILASNCSISQLLIEFHHGLYGKTVRDTKAALSKLQNNGFKIFNVAGEGREYSLIKNQRIYN